MTPGPADPDTADDLRAAVQADLATLRDAGWIDRDVQDTILSAEPTAPDRKRRVWLNRAAAYTRAGTIGGIPAGSTATWAWLNLIDLSQQHRRGTGITARRAEHLRTMQPLVAADTRPDDVGTTLVHAYTAAADFTDLGVACYAAGLTPAQIRVLRDTGRLNLDVIGPAADLLGVSIHWASGAITDLHTPRRLPADAATRLQAVRQMAVQAMR